MPFVRRKLSKLCMRKVKVSKCEHPIKCGFINLVKVVLLAIIRYEPKSVEVSNKEIKVLYWTHTGQTKLNYEQIRLKRS